MSLLDYFMALLQFMRLYGVRCDVDEGCIFHTVPYSLWALCVALFRDSQNIVIMILKKEVEVPPRCQ